jgi:DNA-directed RNA polymerase specialized sigma24 family protein
MIASGLSTAGTVPSLSAIAAPAGGRIPAIDLRRRRGREQIRLLTELSSFLNPAERRLIEDTFDRGKTASVLAAELERDPRGLRREIRRLSRRLLDPRFAFVALTAAHWRPTRRRIAETHFIRGLSLRETARELGISLYRVRQHRDAIDAMFEALAAEKRRG